MLEWKINNSDNALRKEIKRCQDTFDRWFESTSWNNRITKEQMLSKDSPLPHVYYKMCKPFDEVKEKFPHIEECSSCRERMEEWIETEFSFCYEYGCGMKLCKKCANELKNKIIDWEDKRRLSIMKGVKIMTNSEAINVLNNINPFKDNSNEQEYFKSVELAIEVLKENNKLKAEIGLWKNKYNETAIKYNKQLLEIEQLKAELKQSVKLPIQIGNYGYVINVEIKNGEPATVVRKVKVCTYCIDSFNLITKFKLNDNLYELVSDYVYKTREEAEQALKGGE